MGLFNKIKQSFSKGSASSPSKFDDIITRAQIEDAKTNSWYYDVKLSENSVYKNEVATWDDKERVALLLYCIEKIDAYRHEMERKDALTYVCFGFVQQLLKVNINLDATDAEQLFQHFINYKRWGTFNIMEWPVGLAIGQLVKIYKSKPLDDDMRSVLADFRETLALITSEYESKARLKVLEKIDTLLHIGAEEEKAVLFLGKDPFQYFANEMIEALPQQEKQTWYKLISKAQKATAGKPTAKYLKETNELLKELGTDKFKKVFNEWLIFLVDLKEEIRSPYDFLYVSSVNAEAMKGFVWMASHFHDQVTLRNVAAMAERAYRKVPGFGPVAAAIGNACLFTLYQSKGLDGIGHLSRLKLRIKQTSTQKVIEQYIEKAAIEQGVSTHMIEDMAVESFRFLDGQREFQFDDYKCIIKITAPGKSEASWFKPDGSPQKSIPAIVKDRFAARLKKMRDTQKQVDQTTSAQRDRIDRMLKSGRLMTMNEFQSNYLDNGLMSFLSKRIIWNFCTDNTIQSAIFLSGKWVTNLSIEVTPSDYTHVSLWHPALQTIAEIQAWREFLIAEKISQPIKQAFREVYLLTDAELNTKSYSNRMAAHVLKQHQFNVLAKTRGWKYSLLGAFDNGINNDLASVILPEYKLRAEYWVNELNVDDGWNDTGIWNYITTDQIRFVNLETNETVDLIDVPPLVFSEVFRDVDLFVGVASVGNDPTWQDSGGVPAYRDYWQGYAFGELSEIAKNRKEILTGLLPRLKISKVAEIRDKFLVVKGTMRTYKIHIGSTNILMEPNDQYLCIVPDRSQKNHAEGVFLPFEGDNGLSIILSKAFLLAEDNKITDSTITSQINRK